ncbi:tyrosinase family protein [Chitinophaga nivalis]|uniref:Tyrosinase family protein n=1 Tax=Chitinophaga nivalis TaxID=2991709 RepID=A0ABT3IN15_9BACT|nr:tyrosinase family protein [Chitinophaga nivalis]MCW3464970.1 tyrosinase family protein [Chitinophaga nivalis]MCW3485338.1 tyrosinase family protein [Chitinophaga nivalis]
MPDINEIRQAIWNNFSKSLIPVNNTTVPHQIILPGIQHANVATPSNATSNENFSAFSNEHQTIAKEIITTLYNIANDKNKTAKEAIDQAIQYYNDSDHNTEIKKYAFMVFITHNKLAKKNLGGTIPGIIQRDPHKVIPSQCYKVLMVADSDVTEKNSYATGGCSSPEENLLNYFREDPLLNEHHEHWHVVYPNGGVPETDQKGNVRYKEKERHGELFIYMHQQLLAHYEAHRLSCGLNKVTPYDFSTAIDVGYDPGGLVQLFGDIQYSKREKDWTVQPLTNQDGTITYSVAQHRIYMQKIAEAMLNGYIKTDTKKIKLTADLIGLIIESLHTQVESFRDIHEYYGNIHNLGHNLIANAPGTPAPWGVMSATATAVRDPLFYRWHRHINNLSISWQNTQKPIDFSDSPNVLIRKGYDWSPDIIICDLKELSSIGLQLGMSLAEIGEKCFGHEHWNKDYSDSFIMIDNPATKSSIRLNTLSTINTKMSTGFITISDLPAAASSYRIPYPYLNHEQYCYYLRIQNLSPVISKVTIRMFMVPKAFAEDRSMWIEFDKFTYEMPGNSRNVVCRRDIDSSIIRKPAVINPDIENIGYKPLSIVDMEEMLAGGVTHFLDALEQLIASTDSFNHNADAHPNLLDYYLLYKTSVHTSAADIPIYQSNLISILTKYFKILTIVWEEINQLNLSTSPDMLSAINAAYHQTQHELTIGKPDNAFLAITKFIESFIHFLHDSIDEYEPQLTESIMHAFRRVYDLSFCDCGLPYNLLYPRGSAEGMPYYMMVLLTDWNKDYSGTENCCGSMSYCGAKDTYPDIREMGYPFNRPFEQGIMETMCSLDNASFRSFSIKLSK